MTSEQIRALAIKQRIRCEWFIPEENRNYVAYAKDAAQRTAWMERAERKGWESLV